MPNNIPDKSESKMRQLTEEETKLFFKKLSKYIGSNIKYLIDREDGDYVFRFHKNKIFYMRVELAKLASNVGHKELAALGTCFGKFTKTGKFRL